MAVQKPMWEAASGGPERASTYSGSSVNRAEVFTNAGAIHRVPAAEHPWNSGTN